MARRDHRAEPGRGSKRKRSRQHRGVFGTIRRVFRTTVMLAFVGAVGITGVVAYYATKLPPMAEWTVPERPPNVRILAANGALISNRGDSVGSSVALDEMPAYLPEAVIAIEDRRFYWHFGVDPIGMVRAMFSNAQAGGVVQGGSTITQQLAKNLFLKPERTLERKIQEVILAMWLEARLSKQQILEMYLNRVYLGAGAYGVDAAAHRYFGKSARNVTLAEAATLAGLLKAPTAYSPINRRAASEERTQLVLTAMREAGFIDDSEAALALSTELSIVRDVAGGSGRYVADWVMDLVPGYVGAIDRDLVVETTIDLRLQSAAARSLQVTLAEEGEAFRVGQGAIVALDETGAVKALVGGRDYSKSPFNRAISSRRQPGSAFKPFVFLTALEHGLTPDSVRVDQPVSIRGWSPENYTREYRGPVTLQTALAESLNTISAQLVAEVSPQAVAATARRLGITSPLMATPSIALGTSEVSPLELTAAFVPFSNGGRGVIPHIISRITTSGGDIVYERMGDGPGQVIHPAYVGMMNAMMHETVATGTGKKAQIGYWPAAGKTGTSQDFRDAWFIGYTRVLTAGVWLGNDDNKPTKRLTGGGLPAVVWNRFMNEALVDTPVADLPGDYMAYGNPYAVSANAQDMPGQMEAFLQDLGRGEPGANWAPPAEPQPRNFLQRLFGG